jgi:hypothetical protein
VCVDNVENKYQNIVNRDVNHLDEKTNESHDQETDGGGIDNFLELCGAEARRKKVRDTYTIKCVDEKQ